MKFYRLLSATIEHEAGTIFTLAAKHALMAKIPFQAQRSILWEQASKEEALEWGAIGFDTYVKSTATN